MILRMEEGFSSLIRASARFAVKKKLIVSSSYTGCIDWHCKECGSMGMAHGQYGEAPYLVPRHPGDDELHILPSCVVVSFVE